MQPDENRYRPPAAQTAETGPGNKFAKEIEIDKHEGEHSAMNAGSLSNWSCEEQTRAHNATVAAAIKPARRSRTSLPDKKNQHEDRQVEKKVKGFGA